MSSRQMSTARILRLVRRKAEQKARMVYSECVLCSMRLAAKSDAVLRARIVEHYDQRHPGFTPVISAPVKREV